jgi:hypothetical protein
MYQRNEADSISPQGLAQTGRLVRSIQLMRDMDPKEKLATALRGLEPGASPAAAVKTALIFAMDPNAKERARTAYATAKVPSSYFTQDADANEKAYGDALQEFDSILNGGSFSEQSPQTSAAQQMSARQSGISGEQLAKVGIAVRSISAMLGQGSQEKVAAALKGLEPEASRAAVAKTAILFALQPNVQERVATAYANQNVPSSYFTEDADANERDYESALTEYDSILKGGGAVKGPQTSAVLLDQAAPKPGASNVVGAQSPTAPNLKSILKADGAVSAPKNVTFGPNSTKVFTTEPPVPSMPTGPKPPLLPKPMPVAKEGARLGAPTPSMPTGPKPPLLPKPMPVSKGNSASNTTSAQTALLGQNQSAVNASQKTASPWRQGSVDQSQPHKDVSKSSPGMSSHRLT